MSGMYQFPEKVRVRALGPGERPMPDLLVSLQFFRSGNYYYGTTIGLTGVDGMAQIGREQVKQFFAGDQRRFPMDYRVDLASCDPRIRFLIRGGAEFRDVRASVEANPMTDPDVLEWFRKAKNAGIKTTDATVDLSTAIGATMTVDIVVQDAGS